MIWKIQDSFHGAVEDLQWYLIIPSAIAITLFCCDFYIVGGAWDEMVHLRL
jgi:hypothetical protein